MPDQAYALFSTRLARVSPRPQILRAVRRVGRPAYREVRHHGRGGTQWIAVGVVRDALQGG